MSKGTTQDLTAHFQREGMVFILDSINGEMVLEQLLGG